jgi:DDB1- and CUL4-associated factor 11
MAPLEEERSSRPLSVDQSDEENRNESTHESSEGPAWYYQMDEDEEEDEEDPDYEDEPDEEDEDDFQGKIKPLLESYQVSLIAAYRCQ